MLAARLRFERLRGATEALAAIGLPAAVLDRDGRVLAANTLIEGMHDHVKWLPGKRIALTDRGADRLLRQAVAQLAQRGASGVRSLPARARDESVIVHLIPTPGQARDLFDGGLCVMLMTPISSPAAPDATLIRGLFDLSPGEARVAGAITEGLTIDQIAARSGVARETTRSQVKSVMAKTGTNRQSEVAALLAALPKFPIMES
jgi:DNA-binding CsgD family transcriptional regulator